MDPDARLARPAGAVEPLDSMVRPAGTVEPLESMVRPAGTVDPLESIVRLPGPMNDDARVVCTPGTVDGDIRDTPARQAIRRTACDAASAAPWLLAASFRRFPLLLSGFLLFALFRTWLRLP